MKFLHELEDSKDLFEIIANDMGIDPYLVEKDYWIMHALWGLQQQNFDFELKGGTSLSKGFKIIDRFSEDIDIYIHPEPKYELTTKTKQTDKKYISLRASFFNELPKKIKISGMEATRDTTFDNRNLTSAGIRLSYKSLFVVPGIIKEGILLELGFDTTTPNQPINIDSWAYDRAISLGENIVDNSAKNIKCYKPEYTFVEKLQTIARKVRIQQEENNFPINFLRHFYDIHQLYQREEIKNFIGTKPYNEHKAKRFSKADNPDLKTNAAFRLNEDTERFKLYENEFLKLQSLFMTKIPFFRDIYQSITQIREIG